MPRGGPTALAVLCGVLASAAPVGAGDPEPAAPLLERVQEIPLPDVQGRMDHFAIDAARKRVMVAALASNAVEVVDTAAGKRVHRITGLSHPQGVLYVAELDRLFVANGGDGTVRIFDGTSYAPLATIDFHDDPDNLRYDAAAKRVYVGYGEGAIGAVDAALQKRASGDFKLAAHPESFQLESRGSRIFVNVASRQQVAVVDRKSAATTTWAIPDAAANFPMALDEEHGRLFVATRKPPRLFVLDTKTGAVVAKLPAAGDADDLFYDTQRRRAYLSGGEGFLSVYEQSDADHYTVAAKMPSAEGARTATFDAAASRLYLAVPARPSRGAALWVYEPRN
jgi:DNA-binding beta-propeller fold protein YncE